jgi:TRAP-type C4-dicarboxylate transport system permease small subunit
VRRLASAFAQLLNVLASAAALMLLAMVVVVTLDISLRNLTGGAITWANEVSEYVLYGITLLAAPWLLHTGGHVRIDLVLTIVPRRVAWSMEFAADVLGFLVCVVLIRYGAIMTYDSWRAGAITIKNLVFPEWWVLAPLPVIFVLLAIEFVFRLHRLFDGSKGRRIEARSAG